MCSSIQPARFTYDSISNNGQEVVSTETGPLSLTSGLSPRLDQPSAGAILAGPAAVLQQHQRRAAQDSHDSRWHGAIEPSSPADARAPATSG
jgi:hypothetical protein